ncbi:hypothetical protein TREMEDRAFT_34483 [Tremella mesenterica DSM 1558]|uniref:uncharacterized protein n=1 Tax=Tremella mesenterica (strain ATCC 24925 / CBS 8224 / DSM 1558 / NBRC 9311 / NRRL Y-6157 / RJB 2259-6 / UBC 559-6) TaxID=578456 RepID=UPI00032D103A|nr:uncharacterized protein TREMEDRAFT_34483 [Tremella mesenterica DSM 1558]EIW66801.1 hypothetical protein TREMEDRAFT_34483 [Tremella mesenterica DSM 1558]
MAPESSAKIKHFKPYFSPAEVERLSTKQRGKLSVSREEKVRLQACGFIEGVGVRCGFPRKTISTAQTLYMRFHLFFPYKDFNHIDVCLSVLHVSAKLHDTLKKPRDIILASYAIRYPHLVKKGQVDASSVDPRVIEEERKKVLGIERLVLETMCFKFEVDEVGPYVLKLSRRLRLDRKACKAAWSIAVDCHRTPAPLSFPPHLIALGSIYVAALLSLESPVPLSNSDTENRPVVESGTWEYVVETLSKLGSWEEEFFASANQVDGE